MQSLKFFYCFFTFILLHINSWAKEKPIYNLKGYLGVQGGESFHYELELQDSAKNIMKGFAYTYEIKGKDVKATVVAIVDSVTKTVSIQELDIIYNKGFTSRAVICLLESQLKIDDNKNLSGNILTKIDGGAGLPCSKGSLTFSNQQEINELFYGKKLLPTVDTNKQIAKKPDIDTTKPKIYIDKTKKDTPKSITVTEPQKKSITEGKDELIYWESEQIELSIWDGTAIDGDIVTILYNGSVVLSTYSLVKEPKKILLPIGNNELNIITIIAENEGGEPPNTANILLKDVSIEYPIVAHNKVGKRAIIKVKKKEK